MQVLRQRERKDGAAVGARVQFAFELAQGATEVELHHQPLAIRLNEVWMG